MPIRLKYMDFAILVLAVAAASITAYQFRAPASVTPNPAKPLSIIPESGWDAVATVPGTSVTFRYPTGGFTGLHPFLVPGESGPTPANEYMPFQPAFRQLTLDTNTVGNEESCSGMRFVVTVAVKDETMSKAQMLTDAINTEADRTNANRKRIELINGHQFLITESGYVGLSLWATTPLGDKTVEVTSHFDAHCEMENSDYFFRETFYDFLSHIDLGDAPKP